MRTNRWFGEEYRALGLSLFLAGAMADVARADDDPFIVTGIRVEGLQRIPEGTLLNTLPVNIGDRLDMRRVREALHAVHATGFFRDVELRREDAGLYPGRNHLGGAEATWPTD